MIDYFIYFQIWDISSCYTINVISNTAFGIESNSFKDSNSDIVTFIKGFMETNTSKIKEMMTFFTICVPQIMKLFKLRFVNEDVTNFLINTVHKVINYRETNKVVRNDFIQLMIQLKNTGKITDDDTAGDASIYDQSKLTVVLRKYKMFSNNCFSTENAAQGFTFEEIAAQSFVFIIAGYETSAATMSFCLYELALNPEIQKRLQENIDETLEKHGGQINYDCVKEMNYLTMVVSGKDFIMLIKYLH